MEQSLQWTRRDVWVRKLVYPGHTLPTAAAPALVAAGLALHDGVFHAMPALLAFVAGWLIQLGGVLVDNYQNLLEQPEDREHPELVRALQSGLLTLPGLRAVIYACYAAALAAGAALLNLAGFGVLLIGLASIAASWAYSAGPLAFGRRGFADPIFFVFFGVVSVVGVYYVQAAPVFGATLVSWLVPQALPLAAVALGVPLGALTTNILIIDDIRDREFDAVKGKLTLAVRFGAQYSRVEFAALLVLAYLSPFWLWSAFGFSAWVLLPLLSAPFAARLLGSVLTLDRHADLVPMTPRAGKLLLAYSVLLATGVALPAGA
jgi:1,4-dihydroxy-2-naphthoate octaprenyltransferase